MIFHWSLSDSKSPQVSRTLLSILAVLRNAVIWIVSTRAPTPKSSRPFNNLLVIVTKAPITIGTIVTFMFPSFFNSLARSRYLSLFSHSFSFILWSAETTKSTILQILFILIIIIIIIIIILWEFPRQRLSDNNSRQVSRTFLCILADLNNTVAWMVSIRPFISMSFSPFINPLMNMLRAPITIDINNPFYTPQFFFSIS